MKTLKMDYEGPLSDGLEPSGWIAQKGIPFAMSGAAQPGFGWDDGFPYRLACDTPEQRSQALKAWHHHYNYRRLHPALPLRLSAVLQSMVITSPMHSTQRSVETPSGTRGNSERGIGPPGCCRAAA